VQAGGQGALGGQVIFQRQDPQPAASVWPWSNST